MGSWLTGVVGGQVEDERARLAELQSSWKQQLEEAKSALDTAEENVRKERSDRVTMATRAQEYRVRRTAHAHCCFCVTRCACAGRAR